MGAFGRPFAMRNTHGGRACLSVVIANTACHMISMRRRDRPYGPSGRKTKGNLMKTLIARLRDTAVKHAAYRRIRNEIATLPHAEALDLGIFPGDADRIARKTVWG